MRYQNFVAERHDAKFSVDFHEVVLGLASEVGEIAQCLRKSDFEFCNFDDAEVLMELGDVLHYLVLACYHFDISLADLARMNRRKLKCRDLGRYDGFMALFKLYLKDGYSSAVACERAYEEVCM